MRFTIGPALIAAALACGCVGSGEVEYSGGVYASTPDLVTVSPGVSVIADYDEPIFYADGFYWRFYDNVWYRSSYYTGGWAFVAAPPVIIGRIDRPYVYRHYRPAGYVARHRPVPVGRIQAPERHAANYRAPVRAYNAPARYAPPARQAPHKAPPKHEEHHH
jgi:hypothetical protein